MKSGGKNMSHNDLVDKILKLLKKACVDDLELFLIFIETYLRKKK